MDIKEIVLKLLAKDYFGLYQEDKTFLIEFAEILIAEIAKQNEPCAFLHEWIEYHPLGDTSAGKRCAAITSDEKPFDSSDTVSPLFTFQPTAEQIANETAEAIAEYCSHQGLYCLSAEIESGEWKEFKQCR